MRTYRVEYLCDRCGEVHLVGGGGVLDGLVLDRGPLRVGTVAELWPSGGLPSVVAALLADLIWCDGVGEYVGMGDPAWVVLTPVDKGR